MITQAQENQLRRMIRRVYSYPQTKAFARNLIENKRRQCHALKDKLARSYEELDIMQGEFSVQEMNEEIERVALYRRDAEK
jgi:hypothetical protein